MTYFQAIVLAIVQGITEFLPVSSSAHLILVPELVGWQDQGLAFDVAVHIGTLFAVLAFLRQEILQIIPAWFAGWRTLTWDSMGRLGWWVILATIPLGIIGLLGGDYVEQNLRQMWVIGCSTLVFGLMLGWADAVAHKGKRELADLGWQHSLITGGAQVLALIPGTSRSGITMTALLAIGYSRTAAAKFSFLMAVPAIALPGLLKSYEFFQSLSPTQDAVQPLAVVQWDILAIGILTSALTAFLCMHWFISFVQRVGMRPFVIYRILLAAVIFYLVL